MDNLPLRGVATRCYSAIMKDQKRFTITEVAHLAGIHQDTLVRWIKSGKVPEPDRNRSGWRIFTHAETQAVVRYANKIVPAPRKRQTSLSLRGA